MFKVRSFDPKTIRWWYNNRDEIDMNPKYQRQGRLWNVKTKQLLIDSILNEYDVPKLYVADFTLKQSKDLNPSGKEFAVVDGKQRLEAIFDFIEGKVLLASDFVWQRDTGLRLEGLSYSDLYKSHSKVAQIFDDYVLSVVAIITDEIGMINDQFIRLNSSKPLSGAEIRNAMVGEVSDIVRNLVEHDFFTDRIKFNNTRGEDKNLATKLLLMEFSGRPTETKKANLDAFVKTASDSASNLVGPAATATRATLDRFTEIFTPKDPLLAQAGHVPGYYWFVRDLDEHFLPDVRPFLIHFETQRAKVRKEMKNLADEALPSTAQPDNSYIVYNTILRSVDDASSTKTRSVILSRLFRQWLNDKG